MLETNTSARGTNANHRMTLRERNCHARNPEIWLRSLQRPSTPCPQIRRRRLNSSLNEDVDFSKDAAVDSYNNENPLAPIPIGNSRSLARSGSTFEKSSRRMLKIEPSHTRTDPTALSSVLTNDSCPR